MSLQISYITEKGKAAINEQIANTKKDMEKSRINKRKGDKMFRFEDGKIKIDVRGDTNSKEFKDLKYAIVTDYEKENGCKLDIDYKIEFIDSL